MPPKKWFVKKGSWQGPGIRPWRVRDNSRHLDLKATWNEGRLTEVTFPFQGEGGSPIDKPVPLIYQESAGFYRGSIPDEQLIILLKVDEIARTMSVIFYSLKEVPPGTRKVLGNDLEPIGIWGAEERDGNGL